jgi:DNA-binding transcriptional ArsR family regulator
MVTSGSRRSRVRAGGVFGAVADPTRRAILDLLRHQSLRAGELASRFPVSRPAIAKHVRLLKKAGLITEQRTGAARLYGLKAERLAEIDAWIAPYRLFWGAGSH